MSHKSRRLYYHHEHINTFNEELSIGGHADDDTGLIKGSNKSGTHYFHTENVPSMIVAIAVATDYLNVEFEDKSDQRKQELIRDFVVTFREDMVPRFRAELRQAVEEAESDWDAKCRAQRVINRYERLR